MPFSQCNRVYLRRVESERCSILMVIVWACFTFLGIAGHAAQPNIVYILADDLGYGDVSCLNPKRGKIVTPHIDQLAMQGMTFTDAHSGSSVCTPTRYGLLTGRYAWRTRLQNGVLSDYVQPLIAADRLTVPAMLKQQQYHTACIGKWHLGFTVEGDNSGNKKRSGEGAAVGAVTRDGPTTRGFDRFFGFHHARMMKSVFESDRVTRLVEPIDMLPMLAEQAVAYIRERAKSRQPFFLYLPLSSPHTPIVPSQAWRGKSGLGSYADFVMETDWAVGEVLRAIDDAGIAEDTLVIFTSDNGCSPAAGTQELEQRGHFASGPYRGYKADIWEGGHRVPFFVRWPAKVKAGSTSTQLICLTDLMATCAELLDVKLPANAGEDSVSMLPFLLGEAPPSDRAVVHHSINGRFAIRHGHWKLCVCPGSGGWGEPGDAEAKKRDWPDVQLYDLSVDLSEIQNLSSAHPEIVEKLMQQLRDTISAGRSTPGDKQPNDAEIVLVKSNRQQSKKE